MVNEAYFALSPRFYPRFAPLSVSMVKLLLLAEYRKDKQKWDKEKDKPEKLWGIVERQVKRVREVVYEYMNPLIEADRNSNKLGTSRSFLSQQWLLDTLQIYSPQHTLYSPATLDEWQRRNILRRERSHGPYDPTSVAAFLIMRIVDQKHERNWLPSVIDPCEPRWWCFSKSCPNGSPGYLPNPLPGDVEPATFLWTPWRGAVWSSPPPWVLYDNKAACWAGTISSEEDLARWDTQVGKVIRDLHETLSCNQAVAASIIQVISQQVLEMLAIYTSEEDSDVE